MHYFIRVYDDVVTNKSVTPGMIAKTTAAWELSDNLGTEGGWERYIGTRYALFDTYATMIERGIPARIYPCTSDGSEDFDTKAVLRSPAFLKKKRRLQGPYTFGAQMLLNPTADNAQGFKLEWLKFWPASNLTGLNFYIIVDPASKKKQTNDYTTMWVVGAAGDQNYYVVDGVRDRLSLTERARNLFSLHRKWRPRNVGYEEYGLQADIEHMQYVMGIENYRFSITPLGGSLAKPERIRRLVPVFESSRIYLPQTGIVKLSYEKQQVDIVRQLIEEEYKTFPVLMHDDGLDCLSRILDDELGVIFPEPIAEQKPKWMQDEETDGFDTDFVTR
jgi:phage terminase large subunit-like protein